MQLQQILSDSAMLAPMQIMFDQLNVFGIALSNKDDLIFVNQLSYAELSISFINSNITNCSVDLGAFFHLIHSSQLFELSKMGIIQTMGQIFNIQPPVITGQKTTLNVFVALSNFTQNQATDGIMYVSEGGNLTISYSNFEENYSVGRGAIIYVEDDNALVQITDSKFERNYAIYGGVFFSQLNGMVSCERCNLTSNFALYGGVLYSQNEGQANFTDCIIQSNSALQAGVIYSINSQSQIFVSGGQTSNNGLSNQIDIMQIFTFQNVSQSFQVLSQNFSVIFIQELQANVKSICKMLYVSTTTSYSQIQNFQYQLVKSTIAFIGGHVVTQQIDFLSVSSASIVGIDGLNYWNTATSNSIIVIDQTIITINNLTITNLEAITPLIIIQSNSHSQVSNMTVTNSSGPILQFDTSVVTLNSCIFENLTNVYGPLLEFIQSQVTVQSLALSHIRTKSQALSSQITFSSASVVTMSNLAANDFDSLLISVSGNSQITLSSSNIANASNDLYPNQNGLVLNVYQSTATITNSSFTNLSSIQGPAIYAFDIPTSSISSSISVFNCSFSTNTATQNGGSILVQDVNLKVYLSTFINNSVTYGNGGALQLSCSITNSNCNFTFKLLIACLFNVSSNSFSFNNAGTNGGAINYDLYSPVGFQSNTFNQNTAQYGNDYASYPFTLKQNSSNSNADTVQLVSGQAVSTSFLVGVYDQNDQIIATDQSSVGILSSADLKIQISGNNKVVAQNGIYNFSSLMFIAMPNYSSNITFQANSLSSQIIRRVTNGSQYQGKDLFLTSTDLTVNIYFRACIEGEIIQNDKCVECTNGYYSFNSSSTSCNKCFENGICNGTNDTSVAPGYWRSSIQSTELFQCPSPQSCLGGQDSTCDTGYSGRLCSVCVDYQIDGAYYGRTGAANCSKCSSLLLQVLALIGFCFLFFIYITYILQYFTNVHFYSSILNHPTRRKPQTVLIRIITNYSQAIMIVYQFNFNWPPQVQTALTYFSGVSSSQQFVFSFDCIYKQTGFDVGMSNFYVEVIKYGMLPIGFGFIAALVWLIIFQVKKWRGGKQIQLMINIEVTLYVIIYLTYPTISNYTFQLYNCTTFDDGNSYLRSDFSIQCNTSTHTYYSMVIGLPIVMMWVIGFPIFIFIRLYQNKLKFHEQKIIKRYGLFYVGLSEDAFFWEIIVTNFRKVAFTLCATLFQSNNPIAKGQIGILIMFIQMQLLHYYSPYLDPRFSTIEHLGIYASTLTVFSGLFFVQSEVQSNPNAILCLLSLIIVVNASFLLLWIYRFGDVVFRTQIDRLSKFAICRCLKKRDIHNYEKHLNNYIENDKSSRKQRRRRIQENCIRKATEIGQSTRKLIKDEVMTTEQKDPQIWSSQQKLFSKQTQSTIKATPVTAREDDLSLQNESPVHLHSIANINKTSNIQIRRSRLRNPTLRNVFDNYQYPIGKLGGLKTQKSTFAPKIITIQDSIDSSWVS